MSKKLTEYPLDICPEGCKFAKLSVENHPYYNGDGLVEASAVVYCEHESACEYWSDLFLEMWAKNEEKFGAGFDEETKKAVMVDFMKNSQE